MAVHDSTNFSFSGDVEREDLGVVSGNGQVSWRTSRWGVVPGEERQVLGVAGLSTTVREKRRKRGSKRKKLIRNRPGAEQARWGTQALEVAGLCPASTRLIHVMDREADDFALFHELMAAKQDFVIRSSRPRRLADEPDTTLREYLERGPRKTSSESSTPIAAAGSSRTTSKRSKLAALTNNVSSNLVRRSSTLWLSSLPSPARC